MAEYICECQICHVRDIKRSEMIDEVDYIHKGNMYYHKKCYEDWKQSTPATDEEYRAFIFDFIARDLKVSYDYHMCKAQIDKFVKENKMTVRGIYFTLKYFYELKHGDWNKGHGGIGIVPYVYNEACSYWVERERNAKGTIAEIERQMREATNRTKKTISKKEIKPRKFTVNFDAIEEMEDDDSDR